MGATEFVFHRLNDGKCVYNVSQITKHNKKDLLRSCGLDSFEDIHFQLTVMRRLVQRPRALL
jgi:hypothetical protein